ncbi:hypothetical protein HAX54_023975 [Datura stramonium]|uniref:Uncharacterized protein n=1 Tax=Datura stramonium TaxID=4076 RepID=A0ABS8S7A9_DATST|nr:hypothetical protein [Datura stramonium]
MVFKTPKFSQRVLTRDLNGLDIRLLRLFLWNGNSEHSILHGRLNLVHLSVLRKSESSHKFASSLHAMPSIILIFLLHVPLSADLKNPIVFDLHFYFLLLKPWEISLEHIGLGVSFQSTRVLANAEVSPELETGNPNSLNGSNTSIENGSNMLS